MATSEVSSGAITPFRQLVCSATPDEEHAPKRAVNRQLRCAERVQPFPHANNTVSSARASELQREAEQRYVPDQCQYRIHCHAPAMLIDTLLLAVPVRSNSQGLPAGLRDRFVPLTFVQCHLKLSCVQPFLIPSPRARLMLRRARKQVVYIESRWGRRQAASRRQP